jgi:alkanesulfonate monooxygenase SsuD/methylene tetrahydromethanopterin reductase-like flavin-dependent oxidoreductase (luciferase family)
VLLPALRNWSLAQQVATLDQPSEGRVILGVGIASDFPNIRLSPPRACRSRSASALLRACCAARCGPVNRVGDGRWEVEALGPTPHLLAATGGLPVRYRRA